MKGRSTSHTLKNKRNALVNMSGNVTQLLLGSVVVAAAMEIAWRCGLVDVLYAGSSPN